MTKITIETNYLKAEITDPSDDLDVDHMLDLVTYAMKGVSYNFDGELEIVDYDPELPKNEEE